MALRAIVTDGDEVLRKKSKQVRNFGERTRLLLDDMWETMREADGVGLAAPQVGVLRRAVIIDVTEPWREEHESVPRAGDESVGADGDGADVRAESSASVSDLPLPAASDALSRSAPDLPVNAPGGVLYELLNPEIVASEGELCEREGCLSVPGVSGLVKRPERVTVKAVDRNGVEVQVEGSGILAKALCHEIDHLNGVLFTDIADEITRAEATSGADEPQAGAS
ncbi:MAG: peptide deformylase [Clostridiales Family XIII bacterium]|jgi:peptide deformylase|nr:peptide deformylase [Clostridiales Family XIII bacterium]